MGTRAARAHRATTSAVDEEATDIAASLDAIGRVMRRSAWDEARKLPVALTPIAKKLSSLLQETVIPKQPDVSLDMDLITMGPSRF